MRHLLEAAPDFEDWERVHDVVSEAYFPHDLRPQTDGPAEHSGLEVVDLSTCRLADIRFGATVAIESDHPGAMAVNVQLAGRMETRLGGRSWTVRPGQAIAFPPDTPARMPWWTPECEILGLRVEKETLHREYERVFASRDVRMPTVLDLETPMGRSWLRMARTTFENARACPTVLGDAQTAGSVASMILTGLLSATVPQDTASSETTGPRPVHRVLRVLEDDPARAWSPADLAEISGVSVRRLQQAFREHVGESPMAHLRLLRLRRIREDLLEGRGDCVSDLAMGWGFTHLGRFSGDYRAHFGELPSETLARRP